MFLINRNVIAFSLSLRNLLLSDNLDNLAFRSLPQRERVSERERVAFNARKSTEFGIFLVRIARIQTEYQEILLICLYPV